MVSGPVMSAEPTHHFERRFHNQAEELTGVTEAAVQFLEQRGVGAQAVYTANLALEELATNVLKYGYDDTAVHEILLQLELTPGMLLMVLEDDGHEFNPLLSPEPELHQPMEERLPGGLGLHLVRKLADQMHYERRDGRNRLTVKIRC